MERHLLCVLLVLVFGVANSPGATATETADVPDAATLRARISAAEGRRPQRERIVRSFTFSGESGSRTDYRDGKNRRTLGNDGPFHWAEGRYNDVAWTQNRNGEVVLDEPDPGDATPDRFVTKVERIAKPFDAYVISETNVRGNGTRVYVDAATYRIVRRERIATHDTTVTVYDDFRTTAGYTRPWHSHSEDGIPADTTDERITAIDANVSDADVKMPGSRTFVEFPAGKTSVQLPATLTQDGKFLVRVTIGGRGLDFILDTGDSQGIVLDDDIARELGLKKYETHSNAANAQRISQSASLVPEIAVGQLTMRDVAIETVPDIGMELPHVYKAVGLLGFDFIADLALKLDYTNGTATALTLDSFAPPTTDTIAIPARIGSGSPLVDIAVNGALGERFIVDTGGAGGLMIADYFARRHPEAMRDEGGRPARQMYFYGVGGDFKADPIQLKSVRIGQVDFNDFIAYRIGSQSYTGNYDGTIGPEFLHFFTVYTDYANSELYLSKPGLTRHAAAADATL